MSEILERERRHYVDWAKRYDALPDIWKTRFEGATAPENRWLLTELGPLAGLRILDIGCGTGESTAYLTSLGAECVGVDLSPDMLVVGRKLALDLGHTTTFVEADAQALPFPSDSFDVVYASNVMHHCEPERALAEWMRVLKPGGRLASWDPLAHNPVINVYRRMATQMRTPDEAPLRLPWIRSLQRRFRAVRYRTFWLTTLVIFLKFFLVDRIHPNDEPYWEKIYKDELQLRGLFRTLESVDRLLLRLPILRAMAWNVAVVVTK